METPTSSTQVVFAPGALEAPLVAGVRASSAGSSRFSALGRCLALRGDQAVAKGWAASGGPCQWLSAPEATPGVWDPGGARQLSPGRWSCRSD